MTVPVRYVVSWLIAVMLASVHVPLARADAWPTDSVHIAVPYSAGGGADIIARIFAQKLSERWGQPVLVENRTGAAGTIAAGHVARSAPDGYNLFLNTGSHMITPSEMKLDYDPVAGFAPVIRIATAPDVFVVKATSPAKTLRDVIAMAKAKPKQLLFGASSQAEPNYVTMAMFMKGTGTDMTFVPYKGGSDSVTALLNGEIDVTIVTVSTAIAQIRAGSFRALAVSTLDRSPLLPDVPTIAAEANLPGFSGNDIVGLLATGGTPAAIVDKINADMRAIMQMPDIQKKFQDIDWQLAPDSPEEYRQLIKDDIAKWHEVLKDFKIQ